MEIRILVSASKSGRTFDLRCEVREKLIGFLQREYPDALPLTRLEIEEKSALPDRFPSESRARDGMHDRV
jgi:hypothetical protein